MFNRIDEWLFSMANKKKVSLAPSTSRWGIYQIAIGLSLFCIAVSISFFSLFISLWSINMPIAIVALVFSVTAFGFGIFIFIYSIHLANKWREEGSQDKTATKDDIEKILNGIKELSEDIKKLRKDK